MLDNLEGPEQSVFRAQANQEPNLSRTIFAARHGHAKETVHELQAHLHAVKGTLHTMAEPTILIK
jgi:hypothetical protein